jgi:hypothetical protein
MNERDHTMDPEHILAELTAVLVHGSPEDAMRRAVRWLAHVSRARAAALYLFDKSQPIGQFLHADERAVGMDLEPHLSDIGLQAEQRAAPTNAPWSANATVAVRAYPLIERGRVVAVLSLGLPRIDGERDPVGERLAVGVLPLLARRIYHERESARAADSNAQYDRWFRMLDKQMRVLERERQKFSAIVNQTDLYVLVADTGGIIRWVNRSLATRIPAGSGESSWTGRPVVQLCASLCGCASDVQPCPDLLARALTTGIPVHDHMVVSGFGGSRRLYATALPIKAAGGEVDEVMVMFQDLASLGAVQLEPAPETEAKDAA